MPKIITINTSSGEKAWERLSSRIEKFLRDYPVKDGFRVVKSQNDALSYQKGMLQLYDRAVASGHAPEEVGLPPIEPTATIIFEASLLDRNGNVVATATAARKIAEHKDWEIGESSALNRLLATLGYGGEVFDADETDDMRTQGITVRGASDTPAAPLGVVAMPATAGAPKAVEPPPEAGATENADEKPAVPASLVRQIERAAKRCKVDVPPYASLEEAQELLAALMTGRLAPKSAASA